MIIRPYGQNAETNPGGNEARPHKYNPLHFSKKC